MANYSTLQMGSSGQDVEKLQNALINAGYDLEGGADGVFGSKTDAALREYQKANGLTVDGIAGNQTLGKLYGDAAESGPTEYEKTMQELGELKDAWLNRPDFQYDMSKDPFYQQYRDQFMSQGQLAMMDTMGQAAALTGGYGSTYAQAAGQQAYQAYLQQLNDVMPELYGMARDQYDREGEDLYNRLSMMMAEQEAAANIMAQTGDYTRLGDLYGLSPDEIAKLTDPYSGSGGGSGGSGSGTVSNGSRSKSEIIAMQRQLGVTPDGKWGPATQAAAIQLWGTSDADEAWTVNQEMLQGQYDANHGGGEITTGIKNFHNSIHSEAEHDAVMRDMYGSYGQYVAEQIENSGLTDSEKAYLIFYYGITESDTNYKPRK